MAKTTKKTKSKLAKEITEVQVADTIVPVEETPLSIPVTDALKLSKLQLQLQLLEARRALAHKDKAEYIASIDVEKRIPQFDRAIEENFSQATAVLDEYRRLVTSINERLGIDMSKYGFDDETGAVIPIE